MTSRSASDPIWVFDNPRTCSQLLARLFKFHHQLDTQCGFQWCSSATFGGPERIQTRLKLSPRAAEADKKLNVDLTDFFSSEQFAGTIDIPNETYAVAADRLTKGVKAAQENGKIPYIKEHTVCFLKPAILTQLFEHGSVPDPPINPTTIPDHLYATIQQPLVQIRHPALRIPSFYRAELTSMEYEADEPSFAMWTIQSMARWLFDHLQEQGRNPILIDAEDIVFKPEALCRQLCKIWNIDPAGITFEWESNQPKSKHPLSHFAGRLWESNGVVRPELKTVDVDAEHAKWTKEFGDKVANALRKRVDEDMPDYLYLQQFRLKVGDDG